MKVPRVLPVADLSSVWATAAVAVPVAIVTSTSMGATDLTYHLRAGADMLASGTVMTRDAFTFTAMGSPWLNQQWLAQVVMGTAFLSGGWFALAMLRVVLSAVSLVLVMRACRAVGVDQRQAAWLTLGAAALLLPSMTMRPQLFGVACFGGVLAILMDRRRHPGRLWLLIPLAALWSNLHGTFPLLFAMGGAVLLDDLRTGRGQWRQLVVVGLLALLATLVNPHGLGVWRYVAGLTGNAMIHQSVDEWQPPALDSFVGTAFLLSIPVVIWLLARARGRPGWPLLLLLASTLLLGLMSTRGTLWWAMLVPVVLAAASTGAPARQPQQPALLHSAFIVAFTGIAVLAMARWVPFRAPDPVPHHLLTDAPARITTNLQAVVRPGERIFAAQAWGSWIEWALPGNPVAVDSRIELFPADTWDRYADVSLGRERWSLVLEDWDVRVLAVSARQQPGLLERAVRSPAWRLVYRDEAGAVLVRR